jgi:hypothetical protein
MDFNTSGAGGTSGRVRGDSRTAADDQTSGNAKPEHNGLGLIKTESRVHLGGSNDHDRLQHVQEDRTSNRSRLPDIGAPYQKHEVRKAKSLKSNSRKGTTGTPRRTTAVSDQKVDSSEPPVTKVTLSELDVPRIVFNPKLRHDINFDPELHFRPNLDGVSGRRKAQKATDFWNRLRTQLQTFVQDPVAFENELANRPWCLPLTLQAIRDILGTLVPPDDRHIIEDVLNVELLMQQFRRGVANLEELAAWLSRTLKSHCAPMRDEWVDEMVNQLSVGNNTRDVAMIVQGLQTLLSVLEAMKLVRQMLMAAKNRQLIR